MKLNERAILVQLSISTWSANKLDKQISHEVTQDKHATTGSLRTHKSLLPNSQTLKQIKQKTTDIRTAFYKNTLPWGVKGTQLLPSDNYFAFMSQFKQAKAELDVLVTDFVAHYQQFVDDAEAYLGDSYDADDYPDASDIKAKFGMSIEVMPLPADDFRVAIASDELSRIQQDVAQRVEAAGQKAMQEVWQRLYDAVEHMADRLGDPSAIFRDTLVENARELCDLLPKLNFTDDPDLERMRQQVEGQLAGEEPELLRRDLDLREVKAREASEILAAMGTFMQGGVA